MIEELARHGYCLSPGTLYPIMHGLEKKGLLRSKAQRVGSKRANSSGFRQRAGSRTVRRTV
jgi:DNA-binding PadR family transcriptional regulator